MPPSFEAKGRSLIILPTRYGGFGLLLYMLSLLSLSQRPTKRLTKSWIRYFSDFLRSRRQMGTFMTQHVRWQKLLENQPERLREGMEDDKRDFMVEHWNVHGCNRPLIIPYYSPLSFDNALIWICLHDGILIPYSMHSNCPVCHQSNCLGRKEICSGRRALHNFIVSLLQSALQALP